MHSRRTKFLPVKIKSGCFGHNFITSTSCAPPTCAENKSLDPGDFVFSMRSHEAEVADAPSCRVDGACSGWSRPYYFLADLPLSKAALPSRTTELP